MFAVLMFFVVGSAQGAAFDPAASQVCTKFFTCGHFKGPGGPVGQKAEFVEEVTLTATGDLSGHLLMSLVDASGQGQPETYDLTFEFKEDGQFTTTSKKGLYAAGICKENRCTYGMIPFTSGEHHIGNAGIFRFSPGRLERFMYVIDDEGTYQQLSDMKAN